MTPWRHVRTMSIVLVAILVTTMILSYSRGALVAAVVGLACWFALADLRLRGLLVLALGGVACVVVGLLAILLLRPAAPAAKPDSPPLAANGNSSTQQPRLPSNNTAPVPPPAPVVQTVDLLAKKLCNLVCLDLQSGEQAWEADIMKDNANVRWGMSGSPLFSQGRIIVTPGAQTPAARGRGVIAYDATTVVNGKLKQLFHSDATAANDMGNFAKYSTPVVANGKVYVGTFSNKVVEYGL